MSPDSRQRIVLVSGSRRWRDYAALGEALAEQNPIVILHGDCSSGADQIAGGWARGRGIQVVTAPAPWRVGKRAGPQRNAFLVELATSLALHWVEQIPGGEEHVFPYPVLVAAPLAGGKGTQDMLKLARQDCLTVVMVPGSEE